MDAHFSCQYMIIEFINANITIGKKIILKNIHFSLQKHDFIHLKGANGSGKTVFLESMLGFYKCTLGSRSSKFNRNKICYISDTQFFTDSESVYDVLLSYVYFYKVDMKSIKDILVILDFDTSVKLTQRIATLSKGTKKKLQLLPLFFDALELFFLDEIMDGIDDDTINTIIKRLIYLNKQQATIIITEHASHLIQILHQEIPNLQEVLCLDQNIYHMSSSFVL